MPDLAVIDAEPVSAGIIAYLERQLEAAREGKFSAVAVAFVYRDGSTGSGFSAQHNLATMAGSVAALHSKLIRDMLDE